jgi:ring-1,2-phenylacetyl-CoA epoxidase subunit PaaC
MATTSIAVRETPFVLFLLRRADDALVLGHRLSEWVGGGPTLEEEMALGNIGLDLLGQARTLYAHVAETEGSGHDEDALAFRRDAQDWRNLLLVEQPNGDFAHTMVRQLIYSAFADPWWRLACGSGDATVAAVAARSEKESAYHLRHAAEWVVRLGDGTAESRARTERALARLFPYAEEMFEADEAERAMIAAGVAPDPEAVRPVFDATIDTVLGRAGLARPAPRPPQRGGRSGRHGEHLSRMLAEMQVLPRTYPDARW